MTAALPWSAPPPETVRAEPTGWRETSDQPRVRGAWRAPDPRAPGTAPLRGMPRSMPPRSLGQTLVNGGPAKTMRLDMQNVRLLRIRAESASETLRVAPPIGESRTDDGPRKQLEAGYNPGAQQEAESLQGACPLRSGTPSPRPTDRALHSVRRALLGGPTRSLSTPVQQRGRSRSDASEPCATRIRACAGTHERIASEPVPPPRARIRRENGHETAFWHGIRHANERLPEKPQVARIGRADAPRFRPDSVPERGFMAISDAFLCRTKIDIGRAGPPSGTYINFPSRRAGPPKH